MSLFIFFLLFLTLQNISFSLNIIIVLIRAISLQVFKIQCNFSYWLLLNIIELSIYILKIRLRLLGLVVVILTLMSTTARYLRCLLLYFTIRRWLTIFFENFFCNLRAIIQWMRFHILKQISYHCISTLLFIVMPFFIFLYFVLQMIN